MGKRGPEPGRAYGAAAVSKCLKNADFPMSKNDLISKYGTCEIEWTKGNPVQLKNVISNIPDGTFNSPADLEHALHEEY